MLVVDDTGSAKKGVCLVGVQRRYIGTAEKIINCQIGMICSHGNPYRQQVLIGRELYAPERKVGL